MTFSYSNSKMLMSVYLVLDFFLFKFKLLSILFTWILSKGKLVDAETKFKKRDMNNSVLDPSNESRKSNHFADFASSANIHLCLHNWDWLVPQKMKNCQRRNEILRVKYWVLKCLDSSDSVSYVMLLMIIYILVSLFSNIFVLWLKVPFWDNFDEIDDYFCCVCIDDYILTCIFIAFIKIENVF